MNALKTYVFSKARNTRIAFLVDSDTPIALMKKIMTDNYRIWGGTYNPIIPVHDNGIEKKWVKMLEQIDPDIIYHSPTVDARKLQEYGLKVYPRVYIAIPENGLLNLPGVNPLTFVDHFFKYALAERRHVHLPYFNPGFDHILKNLLALNFGVRELSIEDDEYLQVIGKHCIYEGNIEKALSETWSQIGFMQNLLCESYLGNEILQAERWQVEHFELIIYDEDNSFNDLVYYWNRRLYQNPSMKYRQIAVSKAEFEQVANDPFFHNILSHNSGQDHIYVTSRSLTEEELSTIISNCDTTSFRVALKIVPTADFPEEFTKADHFNQQYWIKTLLQANEGFINIPEYPIGDHIRLKGDFEIDIRINNSGSWRHNAFRFPYHTLLRKNISDVPARVNSYNALSFQVDSSLRGIDLQLPPIAEILRSRVQIRDMAGQIELPQGLKQCSQSDAGLLLSAFMELFNNDWFFVRQFALDKFWLEIFTGTGIYNKIKQVWRLEDRLLSETDDKKFKNNLYGQLEKGDGLFSYKDLQHELKCIYNKYAEKLAAKGEDLEEGYVVPDTNGFIRGHYQDDLKSVLFAIDRFVEAEVIFIGLKVKCNNCGSNLWYSLKELSHRMSCRGCGFKITPEAESAFYYKVNDTVLNNLMSDPVKRKKSYGGNYVVLNVLDQLRDPHWHQPITAFGYSPSVDIYVDHDEFQKTDLDIVAIQDGKLIIGEAKVSSSDFDDKQIRQLIWIGNEIQPDVVLLAYKDGNLNEETLEKVRKGITQANVEVRAMKIATSQFQFGALLGLPETV